MMKPEFFEGQIVELTDPNLVRYLDAERFQVLWVVRVCNCTPRLPWGVGLADPQEMTMETHEVSCPCADFVRNPHPQNVYISAYGKVFPLSGFHFRHVAA